MGGQSLRVAKPGKRSVPPGAQSKSSAPVLRIPTRPPWLGVAAAPDRLVVGPSGDRFEAEADRAARQARRADWLAGAGAEPAGQPRGEVRPGGGGTPLPPALSAVIRQEQGGGRPLAAAVRAPVEAYLGADLSTVHVHTDGLADGLNRALQARAFTLGPDLFFRRGELRPQSTAGRELLTHELTHAAQQGAGRGGAAVAGQVIQRTKVSVPPEVRGTLLRRLKGEEIDISEMTQLQVLWVQANFKDLGLGEKVQKEIDLRLQDFSPVEDVAVTSADVPSSLKRRLSGESLDPKRAKTVTASKMKPPPEATGKEGKQEEPLPGATKQAKPLVSAAPERTLEELRKDLENSIIDKYSEALREVGLAKPGLQVSGNKKKAIAMASNKNSALRGLINALTMPKQPKKSKKLTVPKKSSPAPPGVTEGVEAVKTALGAYFLGVLNESFSLGTPTGSTQFQTLTARVQEAQNLLLTAGGQALRPPANSLVRSEKTSIDGVPGTRTLGKHSKALVTRYSQTDAELNQPRGLELVSKLNEVSTKQEAVGQQAFVRLHIVDGGFGGPGTADNLTPAPDYYNTNSVQSQTIKWAEVQANEALKTSPVSYEGEVEYGRTASSRSVTVEGKMIRVPNDYLPYIPQWIELTAKRMVLNKGDGSDWSHWQEGAALSGLDQQQLPILTVLPEKPPASQASSPTEKPLV